MACPEGCGRGSADAGSAAAGHSRLLAEGTKEEEKREDDVAVLGLGGGDSRQRGLPPRPQRLAAAAARRPRAPREGPPSESRVPSLESSPPRSRSDLTAALALPFQVFL